MSLSACSSATTNNNEPNGEWGSPAGVIPAHVHWLAWVDVLGIVSAEFLLRAVTNADRWDLPLALLLFRQVLKKKKNNCRRVSRVDAHNTQDGREEYLSADNTWEGWGFWQIVKRQGQFVPNEFVLSLFSESFCVCVSLFSCTLSPLGTTC